MSPERPNLATRLYGLGYGRPGNELDEALHRVLDHVEKLRAERVRFRVVLHALHTDMLSGRWDPELVTEVEALLGKGEEP